ncbi:Rrf2 family transcriptional regulator [Patescibacteria group bacterium]|nr:MAG: Rrf2 family transcriptional regulator [Patescibacteria group bacterium]
MQPFLRISTRVHDALVFMGKLAVASDALTVEQAATHPLSAGYLEQVALRLKEGGLIVGKRGPGGGYRLARPAAKITVADVVVAVEGSMALVPCLDKAEACSAHGGCASRSVWGTLQTRIHETLSSITLSSLAR